MATIRKRVRASGSVSFHAQVRLKGRAPQTASFTRLTDARRWVQQTEAAIREGRYFPGSQARKHTLAELIDRYTQTILPRKKPNTIAVQRPQLAWWRGRLGHLRLADITPAVLAEGRDALLERFAPGSVIGYLAALSHALNTAEREWQWVETNLVRAITRPRKPPGRVRYLSDDERRNLLEACKASSYPSLHILVVLALSTGCRKMELLSLRWPDVDLQRGSLILHETKNGEPRRVPLVGPALELMRQHARLRRIDTDLAFPSVAGIKPAKIEKAWQKARTQAQLHDFRFHDLRHSCASYLAMNGASVLDIATILGHKTLSMVQRYAHLSQQHTARVLAAMTARVLGE